MPFIENHARLLRLAFAPFTPFYATAVKVRNWLFDKGLKKSHDFGFPVICVGNLCAGGSGKTPLTEYLVRLLGREFSVGIVSRGYGRRTRGNFMAEEGMDADTIGDEPVQYMQNFASGSGLRAGGQIEGGCPRGVPPRAFALYLAARRKEGVEALHREFPAMQVCILDDAYQHRQVKAGLNILVSDVSKPFFRDFPLPCGTLREGRSGSRRAQIVVFSKCPSAWSETERDAFLTQWEPAPGQRVFFTTIRYGNFVRVDTRQTAVTGLPASEATASQSDAPTPVTPPAKILLFTGIANDTPLEQYLRQQGHDILEHRRFGDHHAYTSAEAQALADRVRQLSALHGDVLLLTTQKDYCRLKDTAAFAYFCHLPLAYVPVETEFLFAQGGDFDRAVLDFVRAGAGTGGAETRPQTNRK